MSEKEKRRLERIIETREPAAALIEDLQAFRQAIEKEEPIRSQLRQLSASLRRIVVDEEILAVASPRQRKIVVGAPDNQPLFRATRKPGYQLICSGGVELFGASFRAAAVEVGRARLIEEFDPERTLELKIDGFMKQGVIYFQGTWLTRRDVVRFVANVASGVHSGMSGVPNSEKAAFELLRRARNQAIWSQSQGVPTIMFNPKAVDSDFRYRPDAIDCVTMELISTMKCLVDAPSVKKLEAQIFKELFANRAG